MSFRKYKLDPKDLKKLSVNEKKVIPFLEQAVKEMEAVYQLQKKECFYGKGVTRERVERNHYKHPSLLSPFSYVYEANGHLEGEPFHIRYQHLLKPIAEKVKQAANAASNSSLKRYLLKRAKSLTDGSYREADIAWFDLKNSNIDFSIGPFERYQDKWFFIKRAFQAHVAVIDQESTAQSQSIKDALYSSAKISFGNHHSTDIPKKGVNILVQRVLAMSGYSAEVLFSGEHFPCDLDLMHKYGSRIIIYGNQLKYKFEKLHYPLFKLLFEKRFASKYSKDLLFRAMGWNIVLYELSRQLHKFTGARERLKELYGPIDEANGFASGIEHCKHLVVKGMISQDELEAIIIIHIVWMFADWLQNQGNHNMESYVLGDSLLLNSYLESGAIKFAEGISWPNFSRIFFEIELISQKLVNILSAGSYEEAKKFIEEKTSKDYFNKITINLKGVNLDI